MSNKSYGLGYERKRKKMLQEEGYIANRNRGSFGGFDIVACNKQHFLLESVKSTKQDYYSFKRGPLFNFLALIILPSLIYYFAEEFLFRGFLFWGLWHKIKYHSFWITSLIFSIFHLSKPLPEVFFAFFVSLIFCYLSFKTKSFVPAAVTHFLVAIALNALIIFVAGEGGGSGNKFLNF